MNATGIMEQLSYADRLAALRKSKQLQTLEKQQIRGAMDFDDHAIILPPEEMRETVQTISGSGVPITDVIMNTYQPTAEPSQRWVLRAALDGRELSQTSRSPSRVHRSHVLTRGSVHGEFHVLPDGGLESGHRLFRPSR